MAFLPGIIAGTTGLSALSGYQSANYQAQVAKNNAAIATQNSLRAANETQLQSQQTDNQYAGMLGKQQAAYSGGNLDISQGSPTAIYDATKRQQSTSTTNIYQSGAAKILGYQDQSADFLADAWMQKQKAWSNVATAVAGGVSSQTQPGGSLSSLIGGSGNSGGIASAASLWG